MAGTLRGGNAAAWYNVPWFWPAAILTAAGGLGTGYYGVNSLSDYLTKRNLRKRREKAQQSLEDAFAMEQSSKLGAVLEEFVNVCEEYAPTIKDASVTEGYLAMLSACLSSRTAGR
jgi:hypothetical protein